MESLVIRVPDIFDAQKLIDYFNRWTPISYQGEDEMGMVVVVKTDSPLEYGKEAVGVMGRAIKCYGVRADGNTRFSLLKDAALKSPLRG